MRSEEQHWRLIRSGALTGAMNMALDEALLQSVAAGSSPPILRLYRWWPATLSLGYAQSAAAGIDVGACRQAGVDIVRRPTGGRAVLHDREVTYAVIAPIGPPFGNSVAESYRVIAGILKVTLERFGLPVALVPGRARGERGQAVCFTAPAQYELLIEGCKVAGCAQKRRGAAFLQHGSIPLDLDLALLRRLMPDRPGEDRTDSFRLVGWLNRFSRRALCLDEVESALIECFAAGLGIRLTASEPSGQELALAGRLLADCYDDPVWTLAGPGYREPPATIDVAIERPRGTC